MKIALTIAGSDSGGGAGIQADLRTFAALGVHGTCAITAITAQSSVEVADWVALAPEMVVKQMETVAADMEIAAAKTGMLANAGIVAAVADAVQHLRLPFLVVDPVMVAKGGHRLLAPDAERAYVERLFAVATVVTPNIPETEALLGRSVRSISDMREAAQALVARGARAVLVKGGHLEGDAVDVFHDGERLEELTAPRIDTRHTHGTGCTLSAAIAANLALGATLLDAIREAKTYLTGALRGAYAVGKGHGPLDHLHALRTPRVPTVDGGLARSRVRLTRDPIDLAALHGTDPRDGALCIFAGVVRNENAGRAVRHLEYEAYEDMAVGLMEEIARETLERWPITRVELIHRLGRLDIGEPSVAVAVTAPHRDAAFAACRHAIDTLKARVPIWKKEFYADGSEWLEQHAPPPAQ